ncbi:putative secreted protein (Por secretion system target) [Flavobacterium sp. 1]|uniref:zinc-dependent metalloprotease n=1 Tax=Flavobacterium sp. 1 TaxID=2035200 RepID=UPI000C23A9E7|nr:zinc-dependent metalloprotease family protein [Flavobacterium sp. 1]PJJ11136.1 putative secreted protein (Por secretion system target) [Flavobacterium sp. 1]
MNRFLHFIIIFIVFFKTYSQDSAHWKSVNKITDFSNQKLGDNSDLDHKLLFSLNEISFKQTLNNLQEKSNKNAVTKISIPNSNGLLELFVIKESSNFSPELQDEFPDIRAYSGIGITDPNASISFSVSPNGIQSMVLRGDSCSEFIDLLDKDKSIYILSTSKNRNKGDLPLTCRTADIVLNRELTKKTGQLKSNTGVFKTIRLALSCTGEYANYFGGTAAGALAGMNATMTRVNAVFNKDLALKLEIISNNNLIIYTNASTDPYSDEAQGLKTISGCTGDCPGTWNKEVQKTITDVIGEGNYDIGHLFAASGGGGDAGCIGCVCSPLTNTNSTPVFITGKGSGYTSPANSKPEGSTFDIDYVAHEIGHQIGANHIFSYDIEKTNVSVEPGSGSTIMGYAGITDYNVQSHSDSYFGYASILQIQENLAAISCPINTILTNQTPTINAGMDYIIPKSTPFVLKGTGSDPNKNTLSYCWEQYDSATDQTGSNSIAYPTKTNGPLFRSILPSSSPNRYMPALDKVLAGQLTTTWESLSSINRTLNFTLTGRNNAPLGLAQTNTDAMTVTVTASAGPFTITSQNNPDTNWTSGTAETINWTVNNTNTLPGSANVNIKLSTDGGLTFSTTLVSNIPNNGSAQITVPNISATNCRIMIEPTANIYYAVNSQSFSITNSTASSCNKYTFATPFSIPESETYSSLTIDVPSSEENVADINVEIKLTHPYLPDIQIELINPQGIVVKLFDNFCGASNNKLILNYDDSGTALSCTKTTLQTVIPAQPLAAFNNFNPEGKWTLRVRDAFPGDNGVLESASLTICTKSNSLTVTNFEVDDFNLYPNPNKGNFNVRFTGSSTNDLKVFVYDLLGRQIINKIYKNESNFDKNIQLDNIQTGIYLLKIVDGDRETIKKIVIE